MLHSLDAVILAAGDFPCTPLALSLLDHPRVVCCDSATEAFLATGRTPWRCIGDGDSISPEMRNRVDFIQVDEQEHNDLTKAVHLIRDHFTHLKRVLHIAIVGATGRREDHTIGNIALLADYREMDINATIVSDYGIFVACHGDTTFTGVPLTGTCLTGCAISIFNLSCTRMLSDGLKYPLYPLRRLWQGTLNSAASDTVTIHADNDYLVYFQI